MKVGVLLVLLSVSECSSGQVDGYVGQNVTLRCAYDASQKQLPACWQRGQIPHFRCQTQLIYSDGHKVVEETRVSSRYQLLGRLDEGDVSLTILNLTEADAGQYGCRVETPGFFNDAKHHVNLVVKTAGQTTTSATSASQTVTESAAGSTAAVRLTSTMSPTSSSLGPLRAEEDGAMTVVLVCVLFGFIVLITVGGLFIIVRKWEKLRRNRQLQQVSTLVQLSSASSSLQLRGRTVMMENIYDIEGGDDGGVYQYVP